MKAIVVLMDSLNRHMLNVYGASEVQTPNINRLAARSVVFENHYIGSAPCMPARRDMLTGRINFLERGWGGVEPFDVTLPGRLRDGGVFSHIETDHYHYFCGGGENYHTRFDTWRFHRGQEWDLTATPIPDPAEPEHLGKWKAQYEKNRRSFLTEADYPTPMTFRGATEWLKLNAESDNYLLWVEAFDPHEPFDTPREYLELYERHYEGPHYNWSGYEQVEPDTEETRHLRACYAATVTMADRWLGELLDEIDAQNGWEDTLIVLTADHGHLLGEHGWTGKNLCHVYNELARIPLIVHRPGDAGAGERRRQLTQNVDLAPTLLDYFGLPPAEGIHGLSWRDVLDRDAPLGRDAALYGWWGQSVNVTDGRYTYLRAPARETNDPLYQYLLMPTVFHGLMSMDALAGAAHGRFLPYVGAPVLRVPAGHGRSPHWGDNRLYDLHTDPKQETNLAGRDRDAESRCERMMLEALRAHDAPPEQFDRLGLTNEEND